MRLKNRCFALLYDYTLSKKPFKKEILNICKNEPKIAYMMLKIGEKAKKTINLNGTIAANSIIFINLIKNMDYNGKVKKVINHELMEKTEKLKQKTVNEYIKDARKEGLTFYLASSHTDSAKDHKPWQGKLYYDDKNVTPEAQKIINQRHMRSIQWVMDSPVWFITRPNCRHFFKALPTDIVAKYGRKELIRRYKMHRKVGDRALATPRSIALEEYKDRLQMLEMMYNKHPTEFLRRDIQKTKLLIKKWEKVL